MAFEYRGGRCILKLPENTQGRDFVVGDLHGRFDDLQEAMRLNQFDPGKDRIISCGDLIDRGSGSPVSAIEAIKGE